MKRIPRIAWIGILLLGFILIVLFVFFPPEHVDRDPSFPEVTGPYLGQRPPGDSAQRFAPGIFQGELHTATVFSPDGKEVYWRPMGEEINEIHFMRVEDSKWTSPQVVPFASRFFDSDDPCLSPDGKRLFFTSWRPVSWYDIFDQKERIWYVDKTEGGWSTPQAVDSAINNMDLHWQMSVAENGSLYFTSEGDIYRSSVEDGHYQDPKRLGDGVNTPSSEGHPFVAPDESYLLFSSNGHPDSVGEYDLFLSVRRKDGGWSKGINLGRGVNSRHQDLYPVVSPKENYLFFLSDRDGTHSVYWVDFERIKALLSNHTEGGG